MGLTFADPDNGAELVTFTGEELAKAFAEAYPSLLDPNASSESSRKDFLVGWSPKLTKLSTCRIKPANHPLPTSSSCQAHQKSRRGTSWFEIN